ncbi:MAG: tetratricopeptide repeat protein [Thermoanaerobaculia bacterium]|nr:tetratricopeptide repeat protein [Thermoanaerobaculia bacterium]
MSLRLLRTLALWLLVTAVAGAALSEVKGRVSGRVLDENGDPVADVSVLVTDLEVASFSLKETTDAKGRFKILLVDATRRYQVELSKDGYQTVQAPLNAQAGATNQERFTILSLAAAQSQASANDPSAGAIGSFNEGANMANMGDFHGAQAKFREAIALDPTLADAHSALAASMMAMGDAAGAAEAAEAALALAPDDTHALRIRLEAYEALGDAGKAAEAKEALMAVDPQAAVGDLFSQAATLYNNGDTAGAQPLLQKVVELRPTHAKAQYLLGISLISAGDIEGAKAHLAKFIELAPNDPDAAIAQEMIDNL